MNSAEELDELQTKYSMLVFRYTELKEKYDKLVSDRGWEASARHAERTGGTL